MKIAVKQMEINGDSTQPTYIEMSLQDFFVDKAPKFQGEYVSKVVGGRIEEGCQFAFDRQEDAPIRCIDCDKDQCECPQKALSESYKRYALQRFRTTRIYILDYDLIKPGERTNKEFLKYHTLLYEEELKLWEMEKKLMELSDICFFYRTKCNGFRIGFETDTDIVDTVRYETHCDRGESEVTKIAEQLSLSDWFRMDRLGRKGSQAYWGYPRAHNPVWLNPNRKIL